jgi:hypothetical protein
MSILLLVIAIDKSGKIFYTQCNKKGTGSFRGHRRPEGKAMDDGRKYEHVRLNPADLTFLYPAEIISRLQGLYQACGIDPLERGVPLPTDQRLSALEQLQDALLSGTKLQCQNYGRLPQEIQDHLAWLLYTSRESAQSLQRTQPETPLGFLKGPRGVLSGLLMASWFDLTLGGKLRVEFEPMDLS